MPKFEKGKSGNPGGRSLGSGENSKKIKIANELRQMIATEAPFIISRLIFAAKNGDMAAIKICLDRILPKNADLRETFVKLATTDATKTRIEQLDEMAAQVDARTNAGEVSLESAQMLYDIIEKKRKLLETLELESRMAKLEGAENKPHS